jgi:hypothetical protein
LASLSSCLAPIWNSWPYFFSVLTTGRFLDVWRPLLMRGWICNLLVQLLLPWQNSHSWVWVLLNSGDILLSHLRFLQPGGPGPHIYVPQEQGGPVIPPSTGFPFRCLLWLHSGITQIVEVNLRLTDSRPVCLNVRHPSGTRDQFFFLFEISFRQLRFYYFVAPSLMRGQVCNLLYNCFWALPEQSLLGQSPAELTAIFYYLIWDSPNLEGQVPVFISPRNRVVQLYPRHWVPFLSPITTHRATVEVF